MKAVGVAMTPGRTKTSHTTTLSVKIPLELSDIIRDAAERELLSQSDIVRRVLLDTFQEDLAQLEASA
jgi:hypothetical protein